MATKKKGKAYTSYIFLRLGTWSCSHIWDRRYSTAEYEKAGYEITIKDFEN